MTYLLTLLCVMLRSGQTYFKNLTVFNMFGHFSTFFMKGLFYQPFTLTLSSAPHILLGKEV